MGWRYAVGALGFCSRIVHCDNVSDCQLSLCVRQEEAFKHGETNMPICHTINGTKLIYIAAHHELLSIWRNDKREYEIAGNCTKGEPHIGIRTGAIFNTQRDAIQWAMYNFGSTKEIWIEKSDHYKHLNA